MPKKLLIGCGIPLLLVIVVGTCALRRLGSRSAKPPQSETATVGDVAILVVESGDIEPLKKVEVKSKAGGRVLRLYVDEGTVVRQGQRIADIDPQEVNSQVAALRAQLSGGEARMRSAQQAAIYQQDQTKTSIAQYQQNLAAAKARVEQAQTQANVQPKLTSQSIAIAQANLDAATSALAAQQQQLALLRQSTNPNALAQAQSLYDQAAAQADNDRHNLARQENLLDKGFVSQQAVDAAATQAHVSAANLAEQKQRLATIRQANSLAEANQQAQVAQARGQVRQMEAALTQARADVTPTTRQQDLASARAAYAQAAAQLAAARSGSLQDVARRDDASAAASDAAQVRNQLAQVLVQQADTTLYASMPGVVTKRYVEVGEIISSAISSVSSGTPVFQIADLNTLLVRINVNEVDIDKVKVGMPVEITVDGVRGVPFSGRVRRVSPSALTSSSATSSGSSGASTDTGATGQSVVRFQVEILISGASNMLRPGMSARCTVVVARHRNVVRIPANCIDVHGNKGTVTVVTTSTVNGNAVTHTAKRDVGVGLRGDDFVEITSGLQAGDKVQPLPYTGPPRKTVDMRQN